MSFHDPDPPRIACAPAAPRADALIVAVYRCVMAGFAYGEAACWDLAWRTLADALPIPQARGLFGEFHYFVGALRATATRPLDWRPAPCLGFAADEAGVVALVAAAQIGDGERLRRLVARLGDSPALIEATQSLADALAARGLLVAPPPACANCPAECPLARAGADFDAPPLQLREQRLGA